MVSGDAKLILDCKMVGAADKDQCEVLKYGDIMMTQPVCLVAGVGEGTGAAIVERFARGGYQVAMLARSEERLKKLEKNLLNTRAFVCDLSNLDQLISTVKAVKSSLGSPVILIHNAVRASFATFLEGEPTDLERNFRVNTTSLLYLAREIAPDMIKNQKGSILVTGNTAAFRGVPNYALFAPTKAAQRVLAESLARDLGKKGIHVAYLNIDAVIDVPWTRNQFHPDKPDDFFIKPMAIADELFHVAHQDRSAWSFNVEIRPFGEKW